MFAVSVQEEEGREEDAEDRDTGEDDDEQEVRALRVFPVVGSWVFGSHKVTMLRCDGGIPICCLSGLE